MTEDPFNNRGSDWYEFSRILKKYWFVWLLLGVLALEALSASWGEKRPVGSWFEEFLARGFYYALVIGTFVGAVAVGGWANKKAGAVGGWIAGIIAFAVIGLGFMELLHSIPGIGWRIERLEQAREDAEY